ncbi:hypothetical protein BGAL_0218g00060 [Botrytis galanthina]|uniref:Uncharacterized protein n=1 Tax=Botrytis galanthina TaxID=278940 RepID=A0A4S8QUI7_9HELO|nr:hypothetical protein BGAL_0218g00060 [Botrytis galanthina]
MRLLDAKDTEDLRVQEFSQRSIPSYAILSHRWEEEEVTFEDIKKGDFKQKKGFAKLEGCRRRAREDKYDWVWVDTCCIDKSSSAELSEAINSMYRWYEESAVCYAYLSDVKEVDSLSQSKWFTRGWTLQELIAPRHLILFDMHWHSLGTKVEHATAIEHITGISKVVIFGTLYPRSCNVAQRMSWASNRETTREEDMAYCLMGLFNIHMLPMYGEGSENAFLRLQQEILKRTSDQTLFLWTAAHEPFNRGLLATSPSAFCSHHDCFSWLPLNSRFPGYFRSPYGSVISSNHTPRTLQYDEQSTRYINGPSIDVQSAFGSNGLQLPLLLDYNSQISLSVNGSLPHSHIIICLDILTWHNDRIFLTLIPEHPPSPYTPRMSIDRMGAFRRPASTNLASKPRINLPLSMKRQTITISQVDTSASGRTMEFKISPVLPSEIRFNKAFIFQSDGSNSRLNSFSEPFECIGGVILFDILSQRGGDEQVMLAFGTRQRFSPTWCTLTKSLARDPLDSDIKRLYLEKSSLNSRMSSRADISLRSGVHYAYLEILHDVYCIHLQSSTSYPIGIFLFP